MSYSRALLILLNIVAASIHKVWSDRWYDFKVIQAKIELPPLAQSAYVCTSHNQIGQTWVLLDWAEQHCWGFVEGNNNLGKIIQSQLFDIKGSQIPTLTPLKGSHYNQARPQLSDCP
ncbi:hypothetical protein MMC29_003314 [Sticta canariensis]|nr:hypothetical protein [Sticta canariensis]